MPDSQPFFRGAVIACAFGVFLLALLLTRC